MADFVIISSRGEAIKREIESALKRAAEIIGGKCEGYAKKKAPFQTGRLRNSITHETKTAGGEITETIGTNVEYAPYLELGHHQEPGRYVPAIGKRLVRDWVPPKPFLRPALEDHLDEYRKVIRGELEG